MIVILAIIGAVVVAKFAIKHWLRYEQYKADANCWRKSNESNSID